MPPKVMEAAIQIIAALQQKLDNWYPSGCTATRLDLVGVRTGWPGVSIL